ncbi:ATP-binding cassette domain-containing protein [Listeria sp. FSL L7-1485]|uniref:ATP-binding cassette domain-containing protein n=1 Tax=Listeria immobilis TaxID=2713502 RepID=A0A7X0X5K4_9LIST|nr:ATP-binding cassette domain-containing protein [Listeria immobilis]MBC1482240.1 ATP-binding cassette domain-containing protein [Listeria immobilis]MBC1487915.1 ATP-binding cassette domain-containing protein [Listeria immobilis]MBC1505633.1 ATP-binding cassette domain-containing protein [Listeria immobilis]MBC1510866.1 ATP-binding cassette domain-containing protein [Listeria immobilis]MBC1514725.1 ATP-binding cassette domain-containing protein [Listeria immobilis]
MAIIDIREVKKSFKKQAVLKQVTVQVEAGKIYALLGANGAGKSTLLRIITGLLASDGGEVTIKNLSVQKNTKAVQRLFSYNAQQASVDEVLTGYENLLLIGKLRHVKQPKEVALSLLEQFGLSDSKDKSVSAYSGGMKRRLDLAMSLVGDAEILFLDEPTTGLDPSSRFDLWGVIENLKNNGKTIFLTTQYLEEADKLADTIGFLKDGEIIATGTPKEMKRLAGENSLQLTFDPKDIAKAKEVLADFKPKEISDVLLSVELVEEIKTTLDILKRLSMNQLEPIDFETIRPTLDDVFIALTKG